MSVKVQTTSDGFRVLVLSNELWMSDFVARYADSGCNGIVIVALTRGFGFEDIAFVRELPNLESLLVQGNVLDDSAAADVTGLRQLDLMGCGSRAPIRLDRLPRLESLFVFYRPGIEEVARLAGLIRLHVVGWPAGDFAFLGAKPRLDYLRIEMRRRALVGSMGLDGAPGLRILELYEGLLTDVSALGRLRALEQLALRSTKVESLSFLLGMESLTRLELANCGEIASLAPVLSCGRLETVILSGSTVVADGNLSPLFELPLLRNVAVERAAANYSHRPPEIRHHFPQL